jgi:hypothetical protein
MKMLTAKLMRISGFFWICFMGFGWLMAKLTHVSGCLAHGFGWAGW